MASTLVITLSAGSVAAATVSNDSAQRIAEAARKQLQNSLNSPVVTVSAVVA